MKNDKISLKKLKKQVKRYYTYSPCSHDNSNLNSIWNYTKFYSWRKWYISKRKKKKNCCRKS